MVADTFTRLSQTEPVTATTNNNNNTNESGIKTVVLIDRTMDMVTPMCTQLTYEGLIDEILHINDGFVKLDSSLVPSSKKKKEKEKGKDMDNNNNNSSVTKKVMSPHHMLYW